MNSLNGVARLPSDTPITVVSTRTTDHLPRDGRRASAIPGGPATYIPIVLDDLHQPWTLLTGERTDVTVVHDATGEDYIIPALPRITLPTHAPSRIVVVSPIMQEVDAEQIASWDAHLFVDVQGFVRVANRRFQDVDKLFDLHRLIERSTVIKAGREEVARLTPGSQQALLGTPLLLTGGAAGATLIIDGLEHRIPAGHMEIDHAIGAGDMMLACFAVQVLRGASPVEAAHVASAYVNQVLKSRVNATG